MTKIRIGVATSGGDAPGMNACLRAIAKASAHHGDATIVAVRDGILGLMRGEGDDISEFSPDAARNIIGLSGTILGTSRGRQIVAFLSRATQRGRATELDDELLREGLVRIQNNVRDRKLDGLILIGGDDTCRAALLISKGLAKKLPICVVPATIDNDIRGTDVTIGFDSAVSAALNAIDLIRSTALSHQRVFIVEVMGRNHGYIALDVGIAGGAEEILIPELVYSEGVLRGLADRLVQSFRDGQRSALIVIAEGVRMELRDSAPDSSAYALARYLSAHITDREIRVSVLGHIQRGAVPTFPTRTLASEMGVLAFDKVVQLVNGGSEQQHDPILLGKQRTRYIFSKVSDPPTKPRDRSIVDRHKRLQFLSY